jgi:hypothetical protein
MTVAHGPEPVRTRSRSGIRPIGSSDNPAILFASHDARHDRITGYLRVELQCHEDVLEDVLSRIDGRHDGHDPNRLFRVDWSDASDRVTIDMQAGWLFGVVGAGRRRSVGDTSTVSLRLRCTLNPTRFLAHQPDPSLNAIRARAPLDALRLNPETGAALRASTLDGNDNVLIGVAYAGGTTFNERRRTWWNGVIQVYWQHILDALRERFSAGGLARVRALEYLGTTAAEVYWELETADAISWMSTFCNAAATAHHRVETRQGRPPSQGGLMNSRWVVFQLPAGITLKVYAKTDRRMRFEVVFAEGRVGQHARRAGAQGSGLREQLPALSEEASGRLIQAYAGISPDIGAPPRMADLCDFLGRFNSAVPEENRTLLLRLLLNHRSLVVHGQVPQAVCRALVAAGILRRRTLAHRDQLQFSLAPEYDALARALASGLNAQD